MNPLQLSFWIRITGYGLLVAALVSGCSSMTAAEREEAQREQLARDLRDEITLGREMAAKLLGYLGTYENRIAMEYVTLVGQTLAKRSGRPEINFRFGLLKSDEINAFAAPGGYIFVTKGLLTALRNESELAGVLGHEIAHVNERHMYRELAPEEKDQTGETLAVIMSRGRANIGRSITEMVNRGMKILLEEGLGKEKEQQADEAGMMYAQVAGYNPTSLLSFLKRSYSEPKNLRFGKSLPPFPERIEHIQKFISQNGIDNRMVADATTLDKRFQTALASVRSPAGK